MREYTTFPALVRVEMVRSYSEEAAVAWRSLGYTARVVPRCLRALGATVEVYAVVLTGRSVA